ncbi:DUF2691 family protein [Brassicibacter mesophilus]|uniref:DUF2691 family protein n=1 Tax=Brassicibacter mesophilus TaxID=745119 RepID=UPI003D1ADEFE
MKKRGVRFFVPNAYGDFIWKVLKDIDIIKYHWHIDSDEIYKVIDDEMIDDNLFNSDRIGSLVLSGIEFKSHIFNHIYYAIFGEFKAFPQHSQISIVNTYEEFLRSDCEIVLLIVDNIYYDVYCKNKNYLEIIYQNAINNNFENITYIDENDGRTRLNVW